MNPPYNATRSSMPNEYTETWTSTAKQDPSKGLYLRKSYDVVKSGKMQFITYGSGYWFKWRN